MALTAVPVTPKAVDVSELEPRGSGKADMKSEWSAAITCDSSYPKDDGGYPMPSNYYIPGGFIKVTRVTIEPILGYELKYIISTARIKIYVAGLEIDEGGDLSALTDVPMTAEGIR